MKLYYTTLGEQNSEQSNITKSLGGYKSSSPVPNGTFDNLFGELSMMTVKENREEYIGLMLVNEGITAIEDVFLYFVHPEDSYSEYKIGAIVPATDGDGYSYIESIPNRYSKPLYTDFVSADEDNKFNIGDIVSGGMVGVWIKRELKEDFIKTDSENIYETDPSNYRRYISIEKGTQDVISIVIEHD